MKPEFWNSFFPFTKPMLKRSGNNDSSSNGSTMACPRIKEGQTIWQKATSLRQSLRHSSRAKVSHKSGLEFTNLSPGEKAATLCTPGSTTKSEQPQIRREWGSQRNLARERRSLAAKLVANDELTAAKRSLHSRSLCMSGDWDVASAVDQDEHPLNTKQPRSPRKLTKDSGYETSAQCDPDYANSTCDWLSEEKISDHCGTTKTWGITSDKKENPPRDPRGSKNNDER
ncbi:uncharacterized protein LOC118198597 isoform X2 [Stegodyphus dumicola]|uniref:uncharacterized protein LOC118198597 isoform X2 n=1 Tax=Stegodyphus dumicola TaxID=202533 RepID=UPI0015A960A3|nr:uncharacterized protein LOC118198597 isoform X2 [Stegodyphus dumicola]